MSYLAYTTAFLILVSKENESCFISYLYAGRYFAASTHTLVVNVHSKKMVCDDESAEKQFAYYVNDGLYGSFNGILIEDMKPIPHTLQVHYM